MRIFFVILLVLFSCNRTGKPPEHSGIQPAVLPDTTGLPENRQQEQMDVTSVFLSLVRHIDSSGYVFDTIRRKPDMMVRAEGYIFSGVIKEETIPFYNIVHEGNHPFNSEIGDFDIKPFQKATRVVSYYFRQKVPDIIGGQKWYTDGVIEEWTFADDREAQEATQELIDTELCILYANTGACVCCMDHHMYVFHSRASAFMSAQEKFFKWFISENNITLYKTDHY